MHALHPSIVAICSIALLLESCRSPPSPAPGGRTPTAASDGASLPDEQLYLPATRRSRAWGRLWLGSDHARLEAFEGELRLEYVGAAPEAAGPQLAGASVYRVKNAEAYFARNRSRGLFCDQPARWVVIRSSGGEPPVSAEVWLALLSIGDWTQYRPEGEGYCAGGLYTRSGSRR